MNTLILYLALIVACAILLWLLFESVMLWLAARIACVQGITFRKAAATVLLIAFLTAVILGGLAIVLIWGTPTGRSDLSPPQLVAVALAALAWPVVTVSFLCSGFQIKVREALGLWAAWLGVKAICSTALWVLVIAGVALFMAIARPSGGSKGQAMSVLGIKFTPSAQAEPQMPRATDTSSRPATNVKPGRRQKFSTAASRAPNHSLERAAAASTTSGAPVSGSQTPSRG
jgi:hypothetical protein